MLPRRILPKTPWRISGALYASAFPSKPSPPLTSTQPNQSPLQWFRSQFFKSRSFPIDLNKWCTVETQRCFFSSESSVDVEVGEVVEVPLAQTGEGIAECELLRWFIKEGDQVEEFQPLCEVQSDKATIEITSRYKGKILKILYEPSDIVKVGETLLKMVVEEYQTSTLPSDDLTDASSLISEAYDSINESLSKSLGVLATPAVRNYAKQCGININDILGTGQDGRVCMQDVINYVANKGKSMEPLPSLCASSPEEFLAKKENILHKLTEDGHQFEDKTITLRGFQRSMVKTMTMAAKVPHFHYLEEINCDALVDLKEAFQNKNSDPDVKHTYLPFLVKSLSMALSKYPLMNSSFREESLEVILKGHHNIGIAMATPYGLVVPNVKKVQSLSILEITKEISRLQKLAGSNKLSSEDISGGTITLSNIGAVGGKFGSPLLNLPEVAIIAVGRIQKLPRFADDGGVYPASVVNLVLPMMRQAAAVGSMEEAQLFLASRWPGLPHLSSQEKFGFKLWFDQ